MATTMRNPSLTDVTNEQWALLAPLIPPATPGGRPRAVDRREVMNTRLYLNRTGCPWDMRPHALLPKSTVYESFAQWRHDGSWPRMMAALRAAVRVQPAPAPQPTPRAASLDRQAVKPTERGGARGDDGGNKIHGRTRHVSVDMLGWLWAVVVSRAALEDAAAAPQVLQPWGAEHSPRLTVIGADHKDHHHQRNAWVDTESPGHWRVEIVRRPPGSQGFVRLPKRWVVERTFAWRGRCRRHRKDGERRTDSRESMLRVRALHLMLKRLTPTNVYPPFRDRLAAERTFRRDSERERKFSIRKGSM